MTRGARRAARLADIVSTFARHPTVTASYVIRQFIPIPPGEETRAREIVARLQSPG